MSSVSAPTRTTIALAGNPNAGKTALFNRLTGSRQKVANWPGVTVEKRSGDYCFEHNNYDVVDLPGTYSLSVVSEEASIDQRIACDYLLSDTVDLIVNVIDGSNLERNLYLTLQLLELKIPMILAVNMMDIVEKQGVYLDIEQLSRQLGCPVVALVASQGQGVDPLKQAIKTLVQDPHCSSFQLSLAPSLVATIQQMSDALSVNPVSKFPCQWLAQRLLEEDCLVKSRVPQSIVELADRLTEQLERTTGEAPDILIADARYTAIDAIVSSVRTLKRRQRTRLSERIDRIVLNRFLGIPIFLGIMYLMFVFSINVGGAFQDFFDQSSSAIFIDGLSYWLSQVHCPVWLIALLANGVGKGISTVLTFLPILAGMFFFLALLEDCGYMARAAFVMDRLMRRLGLSGKSFVPMIVGFGCNVPAVMGARSLDGKRDRILSVMMMPFMSCGARLAIFSVFASAFFPKGGQDVIFLLYLTGIAAAILTGLLLRKNLLPGESAPLIMELPSYHIPRYLPIMRHTWHRLKQFITRAGRFIVPVCMIIGGLNAVSWDGQWVFGQQSTHYSVLSQVGRAVTPVLAPLGVSQDNWPATVGLVTGVLAKEVVIGTLNTLYQQAAGMRVADDQPFDLFAALKGAALTIPTNLSHLGSAIENPWAASEAPHDMSQRAYGVMYHRFDGKIGAFAYLLFVLLYFPCVSTMAAVRRELSRGWALFSVWWSTSFAYAAAVLCYQLFTWQRHPLSSFAWSMGMLLYWLAIILALRLQMQGRTFDRPVVN